jgi:DNA (cytosine-5)-methyltransferase 1
MHLFAGIGGGLLADLILGHEPVCAVEIDPYCCAVLRERAAEGWFPGLSVHEGDVRLFDASEYAGRVDCIAAGFPCQDISSARGPRGQGIRGPKSGLYREIIRCAHEIRPRFVFLENSPLIVRRGLGDLLSDLSAGGYAARWCVLGASDVGAPHSRARWWCLASSGGLDSGRMPQEAQRIVPGRGVAIASRTEPWARESEPDRVAHGVPARVHRLRGLGNAQVPLQAAAAWVLLGGPIGEGVTL